MEYITVIVWFFLFLFYIHRVTDIEEGYGKLLVVTGFCMGVYLICVWLGFSLIIYPVTIVTLLFYVLFYSRNPFSYNYKYVLLIGILGIAFHIYLSERLAIIFLLCYVQGMLLYHSKNKMIVHYLLTILVYAFLAFVSVVVESIPLDLYLDIMDIQYRIKDILNVLMILSSLIIFIYFEYSVQRLQKTYKKNMKVFQEDTIAHHYEEIKNIYLHMRGWRHDYHNHIQVMKAHLSMEQYEELSTYLNLIEQDLQEVQNNMDTGNIMADAILNSKLTIAKKHKIKVDCTTDITEKIGISNIDLCVLLGNLLDNAIEACEQIEEEHRFIRIYMAKVKEEIYISIQNSSKEDLTLNERQYITSKRGNHGFGMKRVSMLVDKYGGFLNLQNEPGIFAVEVMLPDLQK